MRLSTIDSFVDAATRRSTDGDGSDNDGEWAQDLVETLSASAPAGASENTFESLFDITGVRAGSLRMPLCDKVPTASEI